MTLPVILEQNHIAARQYHVISLREIPKMKTFSGGLVNAPPLLGKVV